MVFKIIFETSGILSRKFYKCSFSCVSKDLCIPQLRLQKTFAYLIKQTSPYQLEGDISFSLPGWIEGISQRLIYFLFKKNILHMDTVEIVVHSGDTQMNIQSCLDGIHSIDT